MSDIKIDLNRITRKELREFRKSLPVLPEPGDETYNDILDERAWIQAEFFTRVIIEWPWGEVSPEVYDNLGFDDAKRVDAVITDALSAVSEKK